MLVVMVLALFAWAHAENQTEQLIPNCDLVAISHVAIRRNENKTLDIDFSWDRKEENYERIGGPIKQYVVRHGPWVDGQASNETQIMNVAPDADAVTLQNVKPYERYFVQVCAVTRSYRFLFQNDVWDHAWFGWMDLSTYKDDEEEPSAIDDSGTTPNTDGKDEEEEPPATPDSGTTPSSDGTQPPHIPRCDLVDTSYVAVNENPDTKKLSVRFMWDKKESSYKSLDPIDHYLVRHGPVQAPDESIDEAGARYLIVPNDTISLELEDIEPGGLYGLQICAIYSDDVGIDGSIDWNKEAWTGSMDFTDYGGRGEDDGTTEETPQEGTDTDGTQSPETEAAMFNPRCDLVQTSYVSIGGDQDTRTLSVGYSWDKKQRSYDNIGTFDHYLVRHGPVQNGSDIIESEARYLPISNDTTSFTLTQIPPNSNYGLQICAIPTEDIGIDQGIDWAKEAWTGTMTLSSFEDYAAWSSEEDKPKSDEITDASATDAPPQDESQPQDTITDGVQKDMEPVLVARLAFGTDYGVLLLTLAALVILSTIIACVWMAVTRKRRSAKVSPLIFDTTTKEGMALP